MNPAPPRYSLVIPFYNEASSLESLHEQLAEAMEAIGAPYEILFVDDGSTDGGDALAKTLAERDPRVLTIHFRTNRGKSDAYAAGFARARGEIVLTLDADLQDKPSEIPRLLEKLAEGFDMVVGWKQGRMANEPGKAWPSRIYNGVKRLLFGLDLHDSNCGFRAIRREVTESIPLYGDLYRFLPELAHRAGYRVTEIPVEHAARAHGHSKYGPGRFWTGLLDLMTVWFITGFLNKPLQFFGTLGLLPLVAGAGLECYALARKLAGSNFQDHIAAIIIGVLFIVVGFQAIGIGLIGEMLRHLVEPRPARPEAMEGA